MVQLRPSWGLAEDEAVGVVDTLSELVVFIVEEVPVSIEGGGDRAVSEVALDRLGACPLGDEEGSTGVSQRMNTHVGQSSGGKGGLPDSEHEVRVADRSAAGALEDEGLIVAGASEMVRELFAEERGKRHRSVLMGLRSAEVQGARNVDQVLGHHDSRSARVAPAVSESGDLAESEPADGEHLDEEPVGSGSITERSSRS